MYNIKVFGRMLFNKEVLSETVYKDDTSELFCKARYVVDQLINAAIYWPATAVSELAYELRVYRRGFPDLPTEDPAKTG